MRVEVFAGPAAVDAARQVLPFLMAAEVAHGGLLRVLGAAGEAAVPVERVVVARDGDGRIAGVAAVHPTLLTCRLSEMADAAAEAMGATLAGTGPALRGWTGPVPVARRFAAEWARAGRPAGAVVSRLWQHRLTAVVPVTVGPPGGVAGCFGLAAPGERDLLVAWMAAFEREASGREAPEAAAIVDHVLGQGWAYVWRVEAAPVSMASCGGYTPHGARVFGVYTPPELRGRGYATACVAALSAHLLAAGRRFCFLYTDVENRTSNAIYRRIGYEPVGEIAEWRVAGE